MKKLITQRKNTDIEALRAIGLLLVLVSHFFSRFVITYLPGTPYPFSSLYLDEWGSLGVAIFLLLSGYFMIPAYFITQKDYIVKRLVRLWPAYFITICVCFAVTHIWVFPSTVSFTQFLLNIPFINGFIGTPYVDSAHWYLTALLSGILVFSFIKDMPYRYRHYCYWAWLAVLIGSFYLDSSQHYLHFFRSGIYILLGKGSAPVLIMGACLADLCKEKRGITYFTLIVTLISKFILENYSFLQLTGTCIAFVAVVLAIQQNFILFKSKTLIWLGTLSYPIYLIHQYIGYDLMYQLWKFYGEYKIWTAYAALGLGICMGILLYYGDNYLQDKLKKRIKFSHAQKPNKLFGKITRFFTETKWISLYRVRETEILPFNNDSALPWKQLKSDERYWCADPFLAEEKGQFYVFCEMMDCKKSVGLLGAAPLNTSADTYIEPVAHLDCHTSYPNVFKWQNSWYMVPETCARKTIELYQAVRFPDRWEKIGVLAENLHAVDTTVFTLNDKLYAFIYEPDGAKNILSIAELDMQIRRFIRTQKVKEYDCRIGRPAGNVICHQGHMFRPTQYGVNTYGGYIVWKEFSFDPVSYRYDEKDVAQIRPDEIKAIPDIPVWRGCHTYNCVGNIEIIDVKYQYFSPLKPLRSFCKKFRIGGYSFYEGK